MTDYKVMCRTKTVLCRSLLILLKRVVGMTDRAFAIATLLRLDMPCPRTNGTQLDPACHPPGLYSAPTSVPIRESERNNPQEV